MISIEAVVAQIGGIGSGDLTDWIARGWILPSGTPPHWLFGEAELARVRLVRSLRDEAGIEETDLATVLSLVDQVEELRRALARVRQAADALPPEARAQLARAMMYVVTS